MAARFRCLLISGSGSGSGLPNRSIAKLDLPTAVAAADSIHPLLGRRVDSPFIKGSLFQTDLNTATTPYLADHRLGDRPIVPFAAFLEMAAAAIREAAPSGQNRAIRNFLIREPLFVSSAGCRVQVLAGESTVEIASETNSGWTTNAKCSFELAEAEPGSIDLENLRRRCPRQISPEEIYRRLERTGLHYGAAFRTIQSARSGDGEALAHLCLAEDLSRDANQYGIHPTLLDGCLQTVIAARGADDDDLFLPISVDHFEMHRTDLREVWVHTKIAASSAETFSANIVIADFSGKIVARLTGFAAKRTSAQSILDVARQVDDESAALTYELVWRESLPAPAPFTVLPGERWLLIEHHQGNCGTLAGALTEQGAVCEIVRDTQFRSAFERATWTGIVYDARGTDSLAPDSEWKHPEKSAIDFLLEFVKSLADLKVCSP